MPSVTSVTRDTLLPGAEVDARWSALEAMEPAAWAVVAPRVSICLECLGPALLSDDEFALTITAPRCRRCRAAEVAA